jgi:hypothetical protein
MLAVPSAVPSPGAGHGTIMITAVRARKMPRGEMGFGGGKMGWGTRFGIC